MADENKRRRRIPENKRKRALVSCALCKSRKRKCVRAPGAEACATCIERQVLCVANRSSQPHHVTTDLGSETSDVSGLPNSATKLVHDGELQLRKNIQNLDHPNAVEGASLVDASEQQSIVHDTLGRTRYIGPSGSLYFLAQLRKSLLPEHEQTDFGSDEKVQALDNSNKAEAFFSVPTLPPIGMAEQLMNVYFGNIHNDLILHDEKQFRADVAGLYARSIAHPATICSVFATFLIVYQCQSENYSAQQKLCEDAIHQLLSAVLLGSALKNVQALLTVAQYLHNTNERNAAWTLTGSAVRIAYAIGLHRNSSLSKLAPHEAELCRQVWWSLFFYERFLCASLGRPSTITDIHTDLDSMERLGLEHGYVEQRTYLWKIVGQICDGLYHPSKRPQSYLELSEELLKPLDDWLQEIPPYLQLSRDQAGPVDRNSSLLHVYYYFARILASRPLFLVRPSNCHEQRVLKISNDCLSSALACLQLLCRDLWNSGTYNSKTWLDVFFTYQAAMILALDMIRGNLSEDVSRLLDEVLAVFEACQLHGTMARFAVVTREFVDLAKRKRNTQTAHLNSAGSMGTIEGPFANPTQQHIDFTSYLGWAEPNLDDLSWLNTVSLTF